MLAFTTGEVAGSEKTVVRSAARSLMRPRARIRLMNDVDLELILKFRAVVSWSADPRAFELLRGMKEAHWAVAEGAPGALVGMVGAVPLGNIGILCHLAVHHDYRKNGLGARLTSWAVSYLRSQGAKVVRLDSTDKAERLYRSLGFEPVSRRTVYRLEGADQGTRVLKDDGWRISPLVVGDLPELYGVDRWSFGADRSALILATLKLHPGWGLVARDASGRIKGYLVRSTSEGGARIGPFMASTPDAARALLACALDARSKLRGAPVGLGEAYVEVVVPGEGPAHDLFDEFGFTGREDRLRMELGEAPLTRGLQVYGTTPYLAT